MAKKINKNLLIFIVASVVIVLIVGISLAFSLRVPQYTDIKYYEYYEQEYNGYYYEDDYLDRDNYIYFGKDLKYYYCDSENRCESKPYKYNALNKTIDLGNGDYFEIHEWDSYKLRFTAYNIHNDGFMEHTYYS